jgi:hypothetical protein
MIPPHLPNGEVYTADVLLSIAKQIRAIADVHTDGRPSEKRQRYLMLATQIELLAQAINQPAAIDLLRSVIEPKKESEAA